MSDSSIYWYSHCWCLSTDKLHSAGTTNSYPKTFQLRERAGNLQATLCCQIKATWAPGSLLWLCGENTAAQHSSPAAVPSTADGPAWGTNASAGRGERNAWTRCHHPDTVGVTPVWGCGARSGQQWPCSGPAVLPAPLLALLPPVPAPSATPGALRAAACSSGSLSSLLPPPG